MKIISKFILFTVVLCLITNIVFSLQTENANSNTNTIKAANSNANTNTVNSNLFIFESMAKHKLNSKNKAKKTALKSNTNMKFKQAPGGQKGQTVGGNKDRPVSFFKGPIVGDTMNLSSMSLGSSSGQMKGPSDTSEVIYNNTKPGPVGEVITANGKKMFEGWIQFYLYKTSEKENLSRGNINERYFKNFAFNAQARRQMDLDLTTMEGSAQKYVPSQYDFWLTVFENTMNISGERADNVILF